MTETTETTELIEKMVDFLEPLADDLAAVQMRDPKFAEHWARLEREARALIARAYGHAG